MTPESVTAEEKDEVPEIDTEDKIPEVAEEEDDDDEDSDDIPVGESSHPPSFLTT